MANIISVDNIILGEAFLYLPTGDATYPLRNFGKLEDVSIEVEGTVIDLTTKMPEFTYKQYLMGQKGKIKASAYEPLASGNIALLSGGTATTYAAVVAVAIITGYTPPAATITITGVSLGYAAGNWCKVTEAGVGTEYFIAAKVAEGGGNTIITLPTADTLKLTYTGAGEVSRIVSEKSGLGKYASLTGALGVLRFEEFKPTTGDPKCLVLVAPKMSIPVGFSIALQAGEWINTPIEVGLNADPTATNGNLLGFFYRY